jgi:hypothetical protein
MADKIIFTNTKFTPIKSKPRAKKKEKNVFQKGLESFRNMFKKKTLSPLPKGYSPKSARAQQLTATPFIQKLQNIKRQPRGQLIAPSGINPEVKAYLEKEILPRTRKLNIPDALAASQWATEGGRVQGNPQNNVFGLMANDALIQYPSLDRNINDYALTIRNILAAKGKKLENMRYPKKILLKLQEGDKPRYEAHNEDPMTYVNTVMNTPEWRQYAPAYRRKLAKR